MERTVFRVSSSAERSTEGDPLSAVHFVIYIDAVTPAVTQGRTTSICIGNRELFLLKYADDVVLILPGSDYLRKSNNRVVQFSSKNNLIMNSRKSVTMVVRGAKRCRPCTSVRVDDGELEQVEVFKYLGFPFDSRLCLSQSAKDLAACCEKSYYHYRQRLRDPGPGYPLKVLETLFKAMVQSACNFDAEIVGGHVGTEGLR